MLLKTKFVPSMTNFHIIFSGIWPQIQLDYSNSFLQCLYYWGNTAVAAKLISS